MVPGGFVIRLLPAVVFPTTLTRASAQVLGLGSLHCKQHQAWDWVTLTQQLLQPRVAPFRRAVPRSHQMIAEQSCWWGRNLLNSDKLLSPSKGKLLSSGTNQSLWRLSWWSHTTESLFSVENCYLFQNVYPAGNREYLLTEERSITLDTQQPDKTAISLVLFLILSSLCLNRIDWIGHAVICFYNE